MTLISDKTVIESTPLYVLSGKHDGIEIKCREYGGFTSLFRDELWNHREPDI